MNPPATMSGKSPEPPLSIADSPAHLELPRARDYIRPLDQVGMADISVVGGKNASLGEMIRELGPLGIRVPDGFAITAEAYRDFLSEAGLESQIDRILKDLDPRNIAKLRYAGHAVRHAILSAQLPETLCEHIALAYQRLGGNKPVGVAVRSSATAEDLPSASFAGQQETYLNVQGLPALLETCRRCFASLFTDRAISYRLAHGFEHSQVALSIGVQRMVRADLATSGVMFTIDTETGFADVVLINAAYGLGENIVQGTVNPDEYTVFKPTLRTGHRPLLQTVIGSKEFKLVYDLGGSRMVKNVPVPPAERSRPALSEDDIFALAKWACTIEDHYSSRLGGKRVPMDIEWAKDGESGELFIVQARPETVQSRRDTSVIETYKLKKSERPILVSGRSVGGKIATGPVHVINNPALLGDFKAGEILVTDKTDPDWEPIMKKAAAIVTNRGGRTCHAAIVSRELGVPAIVGTEHGTDVLKDGQLVTVSCAEGEVGFIYRGELPFEVRRTNLADLQRPRTKVMMNAGNPDEALSLSFIPNDGVGLAREEFIVTTFLKIHPNALLDYARLADDHARDEIDKLTIGYADKPRYFVDKLAQGVALLAAAFYPKDVILRLSDFKTNEYANLIGGRAFEPHEENPMIGFRGASRYYHPRYREAFALECQAIRKVREDMGLTNLKVMIPFCRTINEACQVQAEMEKHGLKRYDNGLEIYVMCEIPSNVILAHDFAKLFDGFSIGSNDLTQLILGVDRDSEIVAPIFDERNPAVKSMIASVIRACRDEGCKIGICGQAPSDYPDFAEFLVEQGIDSISLTPDTVLPTTKIILEKEQALESA